MQCWGREGCSSAPLPSWLSRPQPLQLDEATLGHMKIIVQDYRQMCFLQTLVSFNCPDLHAEGYSESSWIPIELVMSSFQQHIFLVTPVAEGKNSG